MIDVREALFAYTRFAIPLIRLLLTTPLWAFPLEFPFYLGITWGVGVNFALEMIIKFGSCGSNFKDVVSANWIHCHGGRQPWVVGRMDSGLLRTVPCPGILI